jgi:hypothetical protein
MTESRRRAYLEAMGFDIWLARPGPDDFLRLCCPVIEGKDGGRSLLVCERPDLPGSRLAGDIERALGGDASWAWPAADDASETFVLRDLVNERLFTEVLVFGRELPPLLGCRTEPQVLDSARVWPLPSLDELMVSPQARQALWTQVFTRRAH